MTRNASFIRKVAYITAIALLLAPLAALSQPAAVDTNLADGRDDSSAGGKLSQLRTEYNLSQAELGEIDPASETMKLATLGMRGVAANILWIYANHYKKVEDWDKLELTVQQIIRLQPNFLEVWDFQAHNLAYNVSVEFDDYRMRYEWVKKGIDFLILGTHYNRQEPGLLNQLGWFTGQKVGRADEKKQFRELFRTDTELHDIFKRNGVEVDREEALGYDNDPDNWLVARLWFLRGIDAVGQGKPIRGKSPLLFYNGPGMSRINASAAMQEDGLFFQKAQISWERAAQDWYDYGNRELPTTRGFNIRLNDKEAADERIAALEKELDEYLPGLREKIRNEKAGKLSPEMQAALAKPPSERTDEELPLAFQAELEVNVVPSEILAATPREKLPKVRSLIEQIMSEMELSAAIASDRRIVNFEYWRTRCEAEMTDLAQGAHRDVHDADELFSTGEKFDEARRLYEQAFQSWAEIFKLYPVLMDNPEAQELIKSVGRYRDLLNQLDEPFPANFVLDDLLDEHYEGQQLREQIKLIQQATGTDTKEGTSPPPDGAPEGDKPAAEAKPAKPDEAKSDETKPSEAKSEEEKPAVEPESEKPATETPATEKPTEPAEKPADTPEKADPPADSPVEEKKPDEPDPAGETPAKASEPDEAPAAPEA
jgi:hypothetical protein